MFRSAAGRTDMLTEKAMNRVDAWRMVQRCAADLGERIRVGYHSFRATRLTAYLEAAGRSRTRKPWPRTKARERQRSTTAPWLALLAKPGEMGLDCFALAAAELGLLLRKDPRGTLVAGREH